MEDKIMFQYVMNYKAYRREAFALRIFITLLFVGGSLGICAISVPLGVSLAVMFMFFGAIAVVLALTAEQTYTVYSSQIVISIKGKRKIIPMQNITSVKFKQAFYEKDLATGTVILSAKDANGKSGRFRMRHIFDKDGAVAYIKAAMSRGTVENGAAEEGTTEENAADRP